MTPRPITVADIPAIASLWHDGWHEAHAAHVPATLVNVRTRDAFLTRATALDNRTRVIGPIGAPLGFCDIHEDELNQLFVSPAGRGTGAATRLMTDGEARLAATGVIRAHLFCVPENARAVRFYAKCGWIDTGLEVMTPPDAGPNARLRCIRFEKDLSA